jgi:chromosome segregation ATPase
MGLTKTNSELLRNGPPSAPADRHPPPRPEVRRPAGFEVQTDDAGLQDELGRLADEALKVRAELEGQLNSTAAMPGAEELTRLRTENQRQAQRLKDLERIAEEMGTEQTAWEKRQREYEGLLEEKSEVIRDLHRRLHEQPERSASSAGTPREEELLALSEELERERRQLKDDEEALMQQMRQMEVQMSRERAELARQRNELQRLQNDVRHELELAARDATLRDRLAPLQRRHQDLVNRNGGPRNPEAPHPAPASAPSPNAASRGGTKNSGLFRRLFG